MINTTLCYIEKDDCYLMLYRNKKEVDPSKGKWIGVGGKFEDKESPEECMVREALEETGLELTDYALRGIVTFVSDEWETEYMYLFTATGFTGELKECDEGDLKWIPKTEVFDLNLWPGDRIFLKLLMEEEKFFSLKVCYHKDELVEYKLSFSVKAH